MKIQLIYLFKVFFSIPLTNRFYLLIRKGIIERYAVFSGIKREIIIKENILLEVEIEDWIPCQLFLLGKYEEFELIFLEQNLEKEDTFIDIGANVGLYSLIASRSVGEMGSVISFEPFEGNFNSLVNNVNLNESKNIRIEKVAVSDKNSTIDLFYDKELYNKGMVSSYLISENNTMESVAVNTISVDSYVERNNVKSIKFIKIDIEGGEYMALIGMKRVLLQYKPILQIEIDDNILKNTGADRGQIIDFLKSVGYIQINPIINKSINKATVKAFSNSKNCYFKSIN